ncbi:MAG: hypothetical protein GPJ54_19685, partial [Candidatus Heimdallarchaeota archaeon]|nr:hypothetical protein [Candidatus Heimdallarchaeota archaeon]
MSLQKNLDFLKGLKYGKLSRKNIILLLMVILIGTILFLNLGSSRTEEYNQQEPLPVLSGNPRETSISIQSISGFNISNGFTDTNLFDTDEWGWWNNITTGQEGFSSITILTTDIFTWEWSEFTWEFTEFTGPTVTQSSRTIDQNSTIGSGLNLTLPERDNKARNLPAIRWLDNSSLSIEFPTLPSLNINITIEGLVFLILLLSVLYLNKNFLPELLDRLERGDEEEFATNMSNFFVNVVRQSDEKMRKETRLKKLLVFKDHIDKLIERSTERMETTGAEDTIITGYYELDSAFAVFRKLIRTKDITPLEHAKHPFETGEIDNDKLEELVNLFYISRFGDRSMTEQDGW